MDGDLERLLEGSQDAVRATFLTAREVVLDAIPGVVEWVDLPDHLLAFGTLGSTGRRSDFVVALVAHRAHVNVQLADGAQLRDPAGIVEGTGKRIRHVKCRSVEDARRPAVRTLIETQAATRPGGS